MKLTRPKPLAVTLDRPEMAGRTWIIPPLTRRQARAIFALDPENAEGPETPEAFQKRISAQLAIACEGAYELDVATQRPIAGSALPLEELAGAEESDLMIGIISAHVGNDPNAAVALNAALKKNAILAVLASASADSTPSTATA